MAQHTTITQEHEIEIQSALAAAVCRHHWVIQPATGPVSAGLCQVCGESREFKNYVEASTWGDDKSAARSRNQVVEETVADHIEKDEEENRGTSHEQHG